MIICIVVDIVNSCRNKRCSTHNNIEMQNKKGTSVQ